MPHSPHPKPRTPRWERLSVPLTPRAPRPMLGEAVCAPCPSEPHDPRWERALCVPHPRAPRPILGEGCLCPLSPRAPEPRKERAVCVPPTPEPPPHAWRWVSVPLTPGLPVPHWERLSLPPHSTAPTPCSERTVCAPSPQSPPPHTGKMSLLMLGCALCSPLWGRVDPSPLPLPAGLFCPLPPGFSSSVAPCVSCPGLAPAHAGISLVSVSGAAGSKRRAGGEGHLGKHRAPATHSPTAVLHTAPGTGTSLPGGHRALHCSILPQPLSPTDRACSARLQGPERQCWGLPLTSLVNAVSHVEGTGPQSRFSPLMAQRLLGTPLPCPRAPPPRRAETCPA